MEQELTLEQAVSNIKVVTEAFRGTKQEHIVLELSLNTVIKNLKSEVIETLVAEEV